MPACCVDELRFCHLAREEDGQGLVWTGTDAPATRVTALPPALDGVSSLPVDDGVASLPDDMPALTPALARSVPEAERWHLTVMFCDLVDSTPSSASSTPKTTALWYAPTRRPPPLCSSALTAIWRSTSAMGSW